MVGRSRLLLMLISMLLLLPTNLAAARKNDSDNSESTNSTMHKIDLDNGIYKISYFYILIQ